MTPIEIQIRLRLHQLNDVVESLKKGSTEWIAIQTRITELEALLPYC